MSHDRARQEENRSAALESLSALAREHLSASQDALFNACKKRFFELASAAESPERQKALLDFVRNLSRARAGVGEAFLARVVAGIDALRHAGATGAHGHAMPARLVSLADAARQRWRRELQQFGEHLRLLGAGSGSAEDAPLDPVRIAAAFSEASAVLELEPGIMELFCEQFDTHVLQALGTLYARANPLLASALPPPPAAKPAPAATPATPAAGAAAARKDEESEGWLDAYFRSGQEAASADPSSMSPAAAALFGLGRAGTAGAAGAVAAAPASAGPEAGSAALVPLAAVGDVLGNLQEISGLLQRLRGGGAGTGAGAGVGAGNAGGALASSGALQGMLAPAATGPVTTLSGDQFAALLSELQVGAQAGAGDPLQGVDIRAALAAIVASKGNVGMARQDQDVLDIVTLFFDLVTEDRDLPLAIQAMISRLQLPVLKLALVDRSFFTDRTHPARQLIDAIARAGMGWDASSKEAQDSQLQQLGALVDELLANASLGVEAFRTALAKLEDQSSRVDQRALKLERRMAERAQAEARTAAARDAVHALLSERLDGRDLPEPVLQFITSDWQRVLQLLFLRKGVDSPEWREGVQLVDALVQSTVVPADPGARAALETTLPVLYDRLTACLEMTQGNTGDAQERVGNLQAIHRARLSASATQPAPAVPVVTQVRIEPPPLVPPRASHTAAAAEMPEPVGGALTLESLKRADEIPVGTWFEYENPANRATRRLKLSVKIEATRMFLFADRTGNPVTEKTRKQFALELQSGLLRVIEDTPLVDRTIERIAASLRERAGDG